jgi:caa(3)-type oxidase subunit IV
MADHAHSSAHNDGHGHTNYVKIWGILLVLLIVSVIGPELGIRTVTLITAFGIAVVKAYMVAKYFMHLTIEPKWVGYILGVMLAFMLVFFAGVAPDVLEADGQNWQKLYEEPAPGAGAHGAAH